MKRAARAGMALGGVVALAAWLGGGSLVSPVRPASAAASTPEAMIVNPYNGTVAGTLAADVDFSVVVTHGGVKEASAQGVTGADGSYSVSVPWDAGNGPGIHNGDVVTVTEPGQTLQQVVQLAGYLDEVTGVLTGTARPDAQLGVKLYTNGDMADLVWSGTVVADSAGHFSADLAADVAPLGPAAAPWRGYEALITAVDVPGQEVFRPIQTPNTTLVGTTAKVGGGYLWPGDTVSFSLTVGSTVVATGSAVVDQDGIPSTNLGVAVRSGDVLTTTYHDPYGATRTQVLNPWELTAVIDPSTGTVSGSTQPGAPLQAQYYGPTGVVGVIGHADSQGNYSLSFAAKGVTFVGDRMVVVDAIADPGFTGVGAQQIEGRTPAVSVQDLAGQVSGYGTPQVGPVTAQLLGGGKVLGSVSGTTGADGSFKLRLPAEVRPGDRVAVTTGTQQLPVFSVGGGFTWQASDPGSGPAGWQLAGAGTAQRQVDVVVAAASGSCRAQTTVGSTGSWSVALPCSLSGNEYIQISEVATPASDGLAAGSNLLEYGNIGAPSVSITSPAPAAKVSSPVKIQLSAWDYTTGTAPGAVWVNVDGHAYNVVSGPNHTWSVSVALARGSHQVVAYASAPSWLLDPSGKAIVASTATRYFTVG